MSRRRKLPDSSPYKRLAIAVYYAPRQDEVRPLYVVPLAGRVVLTSEDDVIAVVMADEVPKLIEALQQAHTNSRRLMGTMAKRDKAARRERWEPVLVEEHQMISDLKRLMKEARAIIADFKSGDLPPDEQITFAGWLAHSAEELMMHGQARKRIAEDRVSR